MAKTRPPRILTLKTGLAEVIVEVSVESPSLVPMTDNPGDFSKHPIVGLSRVTRTGRRGSSTSPRDPTHGFQLSVESGFSIWVLLYEWLENLATESERPQKSITLNTEEAEAIYHLARYRAKTFTLEK